MAENMREEALQAALVIAGIAGDSMIAFSPMEVAKIVLLVAAELEGWLEGGAAPAPVRVEVAEMAAAY
jgi:hypothetical protein